MVYRRFITTFLGLSDIITVHSSLVVTCLTAVCEIRGSSHTMTVCVFITKPLSYTALASCAP